jgi:hypothetical protein
MLKAANANAICLCLLFSWGGKHNVDSHSGGLGDRPLVYMQDIICLFGPFLEHENWPFFYLHNQPLNLLTELSWIYCVYTNLPTERDEAQSSKNFQLVKISRNAIY